MRPQMDDPAIVVEGLGKEYCIGSAAPSYSALRDQVADVFAAPFRRLNSALRRTKDSQGLRDETLFWALKDVSFEVKRGEVVGLIGRNGAGKSTLLKILSRITEPTTGFAKINGRVGALLEVGTGFHPELTGRENIYLNGAILGMKRAEIVRHFDEIVAFSEVEKFIDTPVKRYSSGMHLRLAFAVAAHLEPEILFVDEVLAVGDAAFQKKCLGKMDNVAKQGRTVLFVSHNMGAVSGLCSRGIWVDRGQIAEDGPVNKVVSRYLNDSNQGFSHFAPGRDLVRAELRIVSVRILDESHHPTIEVRADKPLTIRIDYFAPKRIARPSFWIKIVSQHGGCFVASMLLDGRRPDYIEGEGSLCCTFDSICLTPRSYTVRLGVRAEDCTTLLIPSQDVAYFSVTGKMSDYGFDGPSADQLAWNSHPVVLPYTWELPGGKLQRVAGLLSGRASKLS
jgi:lipopolysaccharide transport system ATP-binding protein